MSRRALPLLILSLLLCAAPAASAEEAMESKARALRAAAVARLREHVTWCTKKKLFGKRDEAFERILQFEPDDAAARKKLRYERGDDGVWVQHARYKRPRNLSKKGQAEADKTLAAIAEAYRVGLLEIAKGAKSLHELLWARRVLAGLHTTQPGHKDIDPVERELALRYYTAAVAAGLVKEVVETGDWLRERHGNAIDVREVLGETERDELWLLRESAHTLDGRAGLDDVIAGARKAKPAASKPTKVEAAIKLPWSQAVTLPHVRVAGTAKAEELALIAVACEAAGSLFKAALGKQPAWRAGLTVYAFASKGERATFLKAFPVSENPTLKHQDKLDLVYADGQTLVIRALQHRGQLDLAVNEVLNQMLADTFLGSATPMGWHAEGISRYLAWKLTGTRMAINVSNKYAGDTKDRAVPDGDAKWLVKVRAALQKTPAGLQLVLGKGTDTFTARDALVAYGFAVYLIEGQPGIAGEFLKRHHKTKDVDRTCRELCGMPRSVVEHRLLRWLDEVIEQQKTNR